MKKYGKSLLKKLGYTTYRNDSLPTGLSWPLDISRLNGNRNLQTIFDVGANVGHATREFSDLFPGAQIFSFEPEAKNFSQLQNAAASLPAVRCFHKALGSEDTTCELHLQAHSEWHSLLPENNQPQSEGAAVQTITVQKLDTFCRENGVEHIDLLKTDTEGFDLDVLRGGEKQLREGKISFVFSEVGFSEQDKQHSFFPAILQFLTTNGFEFYDLYEHEHVRRKGSSHGSYCNALFMHSKI